MVDLECPSRRTWMVVSCLASAFMVVNGAEPQVIPPRWQLSFPGAARDQGFESTAVPVDGQSLMVVIVPPGSVMDPQGIKLQAGNQAVPVNVIGSDPVSRLGFIRSLGGDFPKKIEWAEDASACTNANLASMEPSGPVKCQTTGWVKQVGGKILPFALLRVSFSKAVPPPGTPLVDEAGKVVAIVFQASGNGNMGYALPAEAVQRVRRDICNGGRLVRGWIGLALRAESPTPQISRVLPNSPAEAAGIQANDVILSIGTRPIADYADAANAFFYLIPGSPLKVKLLRDGKPLEFDVTPVTPVG